MTAPSPRKPEDGAVTHSLPEADTTKVQIVGGPISLRALAVLGLIVFAVGFWHGRQMSNLETRVAEPIPASPAAQPTISSTPQSATAAAAQPV